MSAPSDVYGSQQSRFIVLEGIDGSGKSTQARLLAEWYREQGMPVVLTFEPGGTALGGRLREIILSCETACDARAELLMILAARAQHVAEVISPALAEGSIVISDRFSLSSLAYQGYGRGLSLQAIREANNFATGGLQPDIVFVIDVSLDEVYVRVGQRTDRFEGEGRAFLQRVLEGYRTLATEAPTIRMINGEGSVHNIQDRIRRELNEMAPGFARPGGNGS